MFRSMVMICELDDVDMLIRPGGLANWIRAVLQEAGLDELPCNCTRIMNEDCKDCPFLVRKTPFDVWSIF